MKYTLCITQDCNLRCSYCYIDKKNSVMSLQTAECIINNIFDHNPPDEKIDIGFFGGEPLLEFELIKSLVSIIKDHPSYDSEQVELDIVTNGTIFSDEIGSFIAEHGIAFCLSCDGPPHIQDRFRRYRDGKASSTAVEGTIRQALTYFPVVLVNAVYTPRTFKFLPQAVEYFSSLGVNRIYLNPDYSAAWSKEDADLLPQVYGQIANKYSDYYLNDNPHYINLIDNKIMLFLKGGYEPSDRCRMGRGEFAFAPSGNIYPCERLIGSDDGNGHCIGNIELGLSEVKPCGGLSGFVSINSECTECGVSDYCMNWCGCSNHFSSGHYNRVGPFQCASEKAAISMASDVQQTLEKELGPRFVSRLLNTITSFSCKEN